MIAYAAIVAIQVAMIIDVLRNGANRFWIMALMFLPLASTIAVSAFARSDLRPLMRRRSS